MVNRFHSHDKLEGRLQQFTIGWLRWWPGTSNDKSITWPSCSPAFLPIASLHCFLTTDLPTEAAPTRMQQGKCNCCRQRRRHWNFVATFTSFYELPTAVANQNTITMLRCCLLVNSFHVYKSLNELFGLLNSSSSSLLDLNVNPWVHIFNQYTPSGVMICLLLWKIKLMIFHNFQQKKLWKSPKFPEYF